jgi:hypothetical protein
MKSPRSWMYLLVLPFLALLCSLGCNGEDKKSAEEPAKPPELKALGRLIGTWKDEATYKVAEWTPKKRTETLVYRDEWTLNGRFLQSRGREEGDGKAEDLQLMTFDPEKKVFRRWYFDSDGATNESTGKWDGKTNSFTWTGDLGDGITAVSVWTLADEDTVVWSRIAKDKDGKVYLDIEGKAVRRK